MMLFYLYIVKSRMITVLNEQSRRQFSSVLTRR